MFPNLQRSLTKPLEQVGAEERELLRACRVRTVRCFHDIRFVIKVFASDIAQQPLKHLFDWMQSKSDEVKVNQERTRNDRQPYLGETVLSEFLAWKCESIRSEFDMLIEDMGKVWHLVPQELVTDMRAFMLTLVCSAVSQFDMRIASRVFAYPALLLISVQKKPNEVCERRAEVARGLLAKDACCIQNEKDDLTEKIVQWYRPELVIVAKSGLCPKRLFVTTALVRSLWMCDTQKVEVPPSLNAMEGTGREAREGEGAAGGRQGTEGKSRKGNKVQGLEASQFSSFHRACVSSVGCSNAGGKLGASENMQRCACHPKVSCERKAVHQMRGGTKRGRLRDFAQGRDQSFRSPAGRPRRS